MRYRLSLLVVLLLLAAAAPASMQTGGYEIYRWEAGALALAYPSGWDAPLPDEQRAAPMLRLAQTLVNMPDTRPPGIPAMTLALLPAEDADVFAVLQAALREVEITPTEPRQAALMGFDAVAAQGFSADGALFGLGRAAALPDGQTLVITGRALAAQQEAFIHTFNAVADSLTAGAASEPLMPEYGVLWHTLRTLSDGESAFVALAWLAYGPDNRLYAVDTEMGVIQLDAATGMALNVFAHPDWLLPASAAVDGAGVIYVGDPVCGCVFTLDSGGGRRRQIGGFGLHAPVSIAAAPDGTLYATDQDDNGVFIRAIRDETETVIRLDEAILAQPLLAVDRAGRVLALLDDGSVLAVGDETAAPLLQLNLSPALANAFAVGLGGEFIVATENQGVLVIAPDGEPSGSLGRIVANWPLPGDVVRSVGVAVGTDGTVYIADSDGSFAAITAMSTRVQAGRVGGTALIPGVQVQGALNTLTARQDWTLLGQAGQQVTISAVDNNGGVLDVALRLIAPDGREAAFNDDHDGDDLPSPSDAQIAGYVLPLDGVYTVQVERMGGSGGYSLGVSRDQAFALSADGVTRLSGRIQAALPLERWTFEGQAGQTLTFTMQADSGTLDPLLRLLDARGDLLAENDDADDTALGRDAQIARVRLPADGRYVLEARRFDGEGEYTLLVVATS